MSDTHAAMEEYRFLEEKRRLGTLSEPEGQRWWEVRAMLGMPADPAEDFVAPEPEAPPEQGYIADDGNWYPFPQGYDPGVPAAPEQSAEDDFDPLAHRYSGTHAALQPAAAHVEEVGDSEVMMVEDDALELVDAEPETETDFQLNIPEADAGVPRFAQALAEPLPHGISPAHGATASSYPADPEPERSPNDVFSEPALAPPDPVAQATPEWGASAAMEPGAETPAPFPLTPVPEEPGFELGAFAATAPETRAEPEVGHPELIPLENQSEPVLELGAADEALPPADDAGGWSAGEASTPSLQAPTLELGNLELAPPPPETASVDHAAVDAAAPEPEREPVPATHQVDDFFGAPTPAAGPPEEPVLELTLDAAEPVPATQPVDDFFGAPTPAAGPPEKPVLELSLDAVEAVSATQPVDDFFGGPVAATPVPEAPSEADDIEIDFDPEATRTGIPAAALLAAIREQRASPAGEPRARLPSAPKPEAEQAQDVEGEAGEIPFDPEATMMGRPSASLIAASASSEEPVLELSSVDEEAPPPPPSIAPDTGWLGEFAPLAPPPATARTSNTDRFATYAPVQPVKDVYEDVGEPAWNAPEAPAAAADPDFRVDLASPSEFVRFEPSGDEGAGIDIELSEPAAHETFVHDAVAELVQHQQAYSRPTQADPTGLDAPELLEIAVEEETEEELEALPEEALVEEALVVEDELVLTAAVLAPPPQARRSTAEVPRTAAATRRSYVDGEHRVIVHTIEGQVKRGTIRDVDLLDAVIPLEQGGSTAPEQIPAQRLKAIFFMTTPGARTLPAGGQKVRVTFSDGRQVAGFSEDFQSEDPGFFVTPADTRTNTARIYVFRASIQNLVEG